jgi:HEAT repeat protein
VIAAARGLVAIPRRESLSTLFRSARLEAEGPFRVYAVSLAGVLQAPQYRNELRTSLKSPYEEVRGRAAWALGEIGDHNNTFTMRSLIRTEPSPWVREKMEEAIAKILDGKKGSKFIWQR